MAVLRAAWNVLDSFGVLSRAPPPRSPRGGLPPPRTKHPKKRQRRTFGGVRSGVGREQPRGER
eukprot:10227755-Alexandrium_andersonii.AAC.1